MAFDASEIRDFESKKIPKTDDPTYSRSFTCTLTVRSKTFKVEGRLIRRDLQCKGQKYRSAIIDLINGVESGQMVTFIGTIEEPKRMI